MKNEQSIIDIKKIENLENLEFRSLKKQLKLSKEKITNEITKKKLNFFLVAFSFVLSSALLLWFDNSIIISVTEELKTLGINIHSINPSEVDEILKSTNVYYNQYILKDEISLQFIPNDKMFQDILKRFVFTQQIPNLLRFNTFINFKLLVFLPLFSKSKFQSYILGIISYLACFNFFVLSGILNLFFHFPKEIIIYSSIILFIIRFVIIYFTRLNAITLFFILFTSLFMEYGVIPKIYYQIHEILFVFYGYNLPLNLILLIYAYYHEIKTDYCNYLSDSFNLKKIF